MTIASQIRSLTLLLVLVSAGFGYSFWETSKNLEHQRAINEIIQNMIRGLFEFNIITNEYINSRNDRIKAQWDNRHESLENLFLDADALVTYDDDKLSLKKITANEVQAEMLYFRLEEMPKEEKNSLTKAKARKITQTVSQIQVRIQAMLSEASRMSRRSMERLKFAEEKLELTSAFLVFVFWPIFIASFVLIDRKVIKPIADLQKSAKQLSSGDYETRITVKGNNEVSALAKSYNELAHEIQKKIYSITDKSNRLNESQKELLNLNENLQQW